MENLDENIYEKIQEIFGSMPAKFSVLEEEINIDMQMEYFEFSKLHKDDLPPKEVLNRKDLLFNRNTTQYEKKLLLSQLASLEEVVAYRTIEKYLESPDENLKSWAILAFQESRMVLETGLLEENQVFISTGLGGKGKKLRYFVVLIYNGNVKTGPTQHKVINNEFSFILEKYDSEVEEINHGKSYSKIKTLIPINVPLNEVLKRAIAECNQFGNFLNKKFIITNVKILEDAEIDKYLKKNKLK